ncbi:MAG: ATP-grasp domain-containing protein [Caldilineaceae bacterium]|nr:ATP-grasp domain-containing protein [Caldilineaceae bacterium]MDE0337936.1 ATP-grasp domain-containing protein [Caldilineaceae bacterium]
MPSKRALFLTSPNSYRTQDYLDAAAKLGIEAVVAMDLPRLLAEEWDFPLGADFWRPVQASEQLFDALDSSTGSDEENRFDAVLGLDDSGSRVAALVAKRLGLPHNDPMAAEAARNKYRMRTMLAACGAPVPAFAEFQTGDNLKETIARAEGAIGYPCVVKPEELNGSRGVIRANLRCELGAAVRRLTALIGDGQPFLIEGYIPGVEVALEGLLDRDRLHCLALFDKPDPLEGPYFEETIYVTPSRLPLETQNSIIETTEAAARGLGLQTGPIHAELRINDDGPWIVEVAGRSIGGLCSRILRFGMEVGNGSSLEELILRQACGLPLESLERESQAGGVMMIPIPEAGILRRVKGVEEARDLAGIEDVQITAKLDQSLVPLPEGDAYLGFIFAKGSSPAQVEELLRKAHGCIQLEVDPEFELVQ